MYVYDNDDNYIDSRYSQKSELFFKKIKFNMCTKLYRYEEKNCSWASRRSCDLWSLILQCYFFKKNFGVNPTQTQRVTPHTSTLDVVTRFKEEVERTLLSLFHCTDFFSRYTTTIKICK